MRCGVIVLRQAALVVVAVNGVERGAYIFGRHQRAQAADVRHVLTYELIHKTSAAKLVFGSLRIVRAHVAAQVVCDLVAAKTPDLLDVIFAVEEIGVDPAVPFSNEFR